MYPQLNPGQLKYFESKRHEKERADKNMVNWNTIENERLIHALTKAAATPDLLRLFLDDLMSKSEIEKYARKLEAAELLLMSAPYDQITKMTGLSSTTISGISKHLIDKKSGYQEIFRKLNPHGKRYFE